MKVFLWTLFFGCLAVNLGGEEPRDTEDVAKTYLTAPLTDGSVPQPVAKPMAPSFHIDSSRVVGLKGRKLFIHRAAPPVLSGKQNKAYKSAPAEESTNAEAGDEVSESELILLSAPLLGTATEFRLMATIDKKRVAETIDDGLLVKKEWDEAEKWLESNLEEGQ